MITVTEVHGKQY